ncbi:MAG: hypothetical protein ACI82A_001472 [Candidatus Azotimanducaceae bacterium]|jgi:hypothetical protein
MFILTACSGGGGGSSSAPAAPTPSAAPPTTPAATPVISPPTVTETPAPTLGEQTALIQTVVSSPISQPLMDCLVNVATGACNFEKVPLIGMQTNSPTIDEVMARVIVSHEWMGVRFREVLERMPPEILLLMRSLTGVVISYDIRPSFYTSRTGAMYLDPDRMWLTEEERAVIDTAPDFRSEFAKKLDFIILWRYVNNNTDIRAFDRDIDSVSLRTAALLFHELAHANDFFPQDRLASINRSVSISSAANSTPSTRLANDLPLSSSVMRELAQVSFSSNNVQPTPAQAALTADDIAVEFPSDNANDFYNYSTQFEDLAMSFEEAMMYFSYGISRDVAVTNAPDSNFCNDYVVSWGQRNRIADPAVQARSLFAVSMILPERLAAVEEALANIPTPLQMAAGVNWCDNINLNANATGLSAPGKPAATVELVRPHQ